LVVLGDQLLDGSDDGVLLLADGLVSLLILGFLEVSYLTSLHTFNAFLF
jgi:hypothetical protein